MNTPQFGIAHLWAQSDSVNRSVALLLLLMSLASWSVILFKAWSLWRMRRHVAASNPGSARRRV